MIMVDPKRVELTPFNGIPHLIVPTIVNSDEVLKVLGGLLQEMFRRYRLLQEVGVRNIEGYSQKSKEPMPYIVLVIDELADLMMGSGYEAEQALVRLAQLGRATGIHLILCTQRPSVNVVTGLLKANIPARIAFAVSSQVDSRVILDGAGADKLLGKGDMLFLSAQSPKPRRIQGAFVFDGEIEGIVDFWKSQKGPLLPQISLEPSQNTGSFGSEDEDEDELLDKARDMADRYGHVSPSLLQRRLQIGYPRAMQLIDTLEEEGLVEAGDPGRSRETLRKRAGSFLE
jgi:S-DNA-T family DNA segregation ATPase FtsK/SpoIIIE